MKNKNSFLLEFIGLVLFAMIMSCKHENYFNTTKPVKSIRGEAGTFNNKILTQEIKYL
jgi:hypothetical protein